MFQNYCPISQGPTRVCVIIDDDKLQQKLVYPSHVMSSTLRIYCVKMVYAMGAAKNMEQKGKKS